MNNRKGLIGPFVLSLSCTMSRSTPRPAPNQSGGEGGREGGGEGGTEGGGEGGRDGGGEGGRDGGGEGRREGGSAALETKGGTRNRAVKGRSFHPLQGPVFKDAATGSPISSFS